MMSQPIHSPPPQQLLQNSHEDGSHAALRILVLSCCMWELLYRAAERCILPILVAWIVTRQQQQQQQLRRPSSSSSSSSSTTVITNNVKNQEEENEIYKQKKKINNGDDDGGGGGGVPFRRNDNRNEIITIDEHVVVVVVEEEEEEDDITQQQQQYHIILLQRGPSYLVSFTHSIYATFRGCQHLYQLWNASHLDKLLIPAAVSSSSLSSSSSSSSSLAATAYYYNDYYDHRGAHLQVAHTNTLFLAYLLYDVCHILYQYPQLGGIDTILHHVLFASCSVINGTFGVMAFAFGWLIVGEASTIFLNVRWFLLKSSSLSGRRSHDRKTTRQCSPMEKKKKKEEEGIQDGPSSSSWITMINGMFALTFFITRIVIYSMGMIHLFYYSWEELLLLPKVSGVPPSMLLLTCGCMMLGWVLNMVWGCKILSMVLDGGGGGGGKRGSSSSTTTTVRNSRNKKKMQ